MHSSNGSPDDSQPTAPQDPDRPSGAAPAAGQRGRFRAARPPAQAPAPRRRSTARPAPAEDHSHLDKSPAERAATGSWPAAGRTPGDTPRDASPAADHPAPRGDGDAHRSAARGTTAVATVEDDPHGHRPTGTGGDGRRRDPDGGSGPTGGDSAQETSDADVVRAGGSMAVATLLSRITGFLRTVLIGAALGPAVSSAFNVANTLPNLITELVLGAVLTSLVVPVLVRAEKEDADHGEAFIRRLLTVTMTMTLVITVASVLAAPLLTRVTLDADGQVNVGMSTSFAYLVLPQIVFYAMFAVFMAVLNTKGVFRPGAWAPVVNNVVTLLVLGLYYMLPQDTKLHATDTVTVANPHVLLLGLGTTAGVVVQALIMVPYLRKAGIPLRPLWGIDERLRSFGGMALAIVVYVAISQLGYVLNNRIAGDADAAAPTIYANAWQMLQVPYGVIGVTLLTAIMPRLSRNAADGDDRAVVRDLTTATRLTMLALVPVIVFFTAFGTVLGPALFNFREFDLASANVLGLTISFSAFTLIPYALVLLHLRVFYAREEVWTPTFIITGITVTKVALAYTAPLVATEPRMVVVLLGAANGFGFVTGAVVGHLLLRRSLGSLGVREVSRTVVWALGSSAVAALIVWRVDVLLETYVFPAENPWFIVRLLIIGPLFLVITGLILSRSRLPEVLTVGAALSRLPGLGRVIRVRGEDDAVPAAGRPAPVSAVDLASEAVLGGGDNMTTLLPPLSAGRVRGPRLVPGAPILRGRFRLLADHGGSRAARLWQAREMVNGTAATGDVVALTILDPVVAAGSQDRAAVAEAHRRILDDTALLGRVTGPGIARVREVVDGGSLIVVVADWVEGAPLPSVAESGPDPLAAGYAVADLADAVALAHGCGTCLGLDHRNRLRISTAGSAVAAFPGVLPGNSPRQDIHGIGVALDLLLANVPEEEVPGALRDLCEEARGVEGVDPHDLARRLREITTGGAGTGDVRDDGDDGVDDGSGGGRAGSGARAGAGSTARPAGDAVAQAWDVRADETPDPHARAGFGAGSATRTRVVLTAVGAVLAVIVAAVVIAVAVTTLGGDRQDAPLTSDSLRQGVERSGAPATVTPTSAEEWMPADGRGTPDSPADAPRIIDGDPATAWRSATYDAQLGPDATSVKAGLGLLLRLPSPTTVTSVHVEGGRAGTTVELRAATGDPTTLGDTHLLTTQTLSDGATDLTVPDGVPGDRLLLWITALPMPDAASVGEVTVAGTVSGDGSGSGSGSGATTAPEPAAAGARSAH
ncbi:lipid II flippase MurJ [Corynebacterium bovis]|uniref:murein biosynthesis integral membrane protein MurJ n=1 Tax=Corynebacterium bovis TaxID=36808 RepID=UPI00244C96AC|nr:murein biosynthesis integral membrane protein MurJ [Corynebacterium bovis]MDH2456792.1 lipid II flippase MurJ [Corynebacterium bovis]